MRMSLSASEGAVSRRQRGSVNAAADLEAFPETKHPEVQDLEPDTPKASSRRRYTPCLLLVFTLVAASLMAANIMGMVRPTDGLVSAALQPLHRTFAHGRTPPLPSPPGSLPLQSSTSLHCFFD